MKAWDSEERREKASKTQLKLWDNEERKKKQSQVQKKLWKNDIYAVKCSKRGNDVYRYRGIS